MLGPFNFIESTCVHSRYEQSPVSPSTCTFIFFDALTTYYTPWIHISARKSHLWHTFLFAVRGYYVFDILLTINVGIRYRRFPVSATRRTKKIMKSPSSPTNYYAVIYQSPVFFLFIEIIYCVYFNWKLQMHYAWWRVNLRIKCGLAVCVCSFPL